MHIVDKAVLKLASVRDKPKIDKEEIACGAINRNVYAAYIRASKSVLLLVAFIILQLLRLVSEIMMRLSQAKWATLSFKIAYSAEYLKQYVIFLTTYLVSYLGSALLLAAILVNSAR